jgi:hypothetical protein
VSIQDCSRLLQGFLPRGQSLDGPAGFVAKAALGAMVGANAVGVVNHCGGRWREVTFDQGWWNLLGYFNSSCANSYCWLQQDRQECDKEMGRDRQCEVDGCRNRDVWMSQSRESASGIVVCTSFVLFTPCRKRGNLKADAGSGTAAKRQTGGDVC